MQGDLTVRLSKIYKKPGADLKSPGSICISNINFVWIGPISHLNQLMRDEQLLYKNNGVLLDFADWSMKGEISAVAKGHADCSGLD